MSIEHKVALITGGASGIGLHIAQVFSKKGAKINVKDLRISITVARYSVVMFAISMFAIFSKKIFT